MKVKYKPTGQLGEIPDDKFDPKLFEQIGDVQGMSVQQAIQPQPQKQQPQQPQKDGFIKSVAKAIVKPGVDAAKLVMGTSYEGARAFDSKVLGNKDAYDPKKGAKNPFLSREEIQKKYSNPKDIAINVGKNAAGAASYFVPGGKAVGFIPKVANAARVGAVSGGLYSASQSEKNDVEGIATDATTGAISGGLVGGAVGAIGATVSKLKDAGNAARQGVIKPKVQPSPFMANEESMIQKTLEKLGLKGSAQGQKQKIPQVFNDLTDEIQVKLKESHKGVSEQALEETVDQALNQNINYDPEIPVMAGAKSKFLTQLKNAAGVVSGSSDDATKTIGLEGIFKYKQNLGKQLSRAFDKVEKGMPLTEKEDVAMTIWHSIDDVIANAAPEIKDLTRTQSYLFKAMPGIAKQSEKGLTLPLIGNLGSTAGRAAQAGQDLLGRGMQAVGSAAQAVPEQAGNAVIKGAAMTAANSAMPKPQPQVQGVEDTTVPQPQQEEQPQYVDPQGQYQIMADGKAYSMDNQWVYDQAQDDWIPNEAASSEATATTETGQIDWSNEDYVLQLMQQDLIKTGGKNIPELEKMHTIAKTKDKSAKLSAAQQKRIGALDQAEGIYTMVEDLAHNAGTGVGAYGKSLVGKLPGVEGGAEEDLDRVTQALAKGLAGALANEVGVATDKDIQRWMGLMPKVTDTMEERNRALERLKNEIQRARQTIAGNREEEAGMDINSAIAY